MKWVVVIAVQTNLDLLNLSPSALGEGCMALGYSQCAFTVASLAEFIRGLGYQAIPSVSEFAQCVPFAMDAGLGELGRMNRLVTPEFGPAVRLCKIFTDMPMACDKPIDFGLVEFCKRCRRCAAACPSHALSFDEEPSFKTTGPWNNAGHNAWFDDASKCYQYSQQMGANTCSICLAACPYTKAACARAYAVGKATASVQPTVDGVFRIMKAASDPNKQKNPEEWWEPDPPNLGRGG